ncbi:ABC transporter substrate-binding protein [Desulfogranum japonicum]|uniref:ABC transporter substrate-binding protein n=1 Tax=Desulfogranum japonicum TaxID=231447 RepID=UPI00048F46EA|nr:ABC transporter substrate-binding protein [Desulfogranum japonicum]
MKIQLGCIHMWVWSLALFVFMACAGTVVAGTIKIGAILAETGPASFLGAPESRSLMMLVEQINEQGGINGNSIELIVKDSQGSPEKAISFARQLIEEEKVFAIIGPSTSGESLKIKKICQDGKTILISCSAAELIVNPVAPYVFKTAPSDSFAARQIYSTMKTRGISKIAVLAGNTGFGKAGKKQLEKYADEYGVTILAEEVYDKQSTDLSAVVAKLQANPEIQAVVNWSVVPAQSILAKNIRQAGWNVPLFQSHGFANIKYVVAAGAAAEGIMFPASRLLVAEELEESPVKQFLLNYKNSYEKRFKEEASTFGGHTYDAMTILAKAIETAGTDKEKVRQAIESTTGLIGTAGEFNFSTQDHNGLDMDTFVMLTVKDGKFTLLHNK